MRTLFTFFIVILFIGIAGCGTEPGDGNGDSGEMTEEQIQTHAQEIAEENIIIDTHIDVPYRLQDEYEDISQATEGGDFDYPRAIEGGLDAPFMSIYTPAELQETGGAKAHADSLIEMVRGFAEQWPDKFAVATSVEDVRSQFEEDGLISLPMGMENGAPIEDDLANVQYFYDRGIRYITLAHSRVNQISDSSYDTTRTWHGLSPFGEEVVQEMNRVGIMVDVSHITDSSFYDVMDVTSAPVIASHSSCRHFTPGFERNMGDEMIERLAENGGVIMINFGSSFLSEDYRDRRQAAEEHIEEYLETNDLSREDEEAQTYISNYYDENVGFADISDVVAHINHVVDLVGVDYVGLGSDFDGVGDTLPTGLKDVADYPNLVRELLKEDYSEEDIAKILGGNLLRVWSEVERVASAS